jgi:hypothetical protein
MFINKADVLLIDHVPRELSPNSSYTRIASVPRMHPSHIHNNMASTMSTILTMFSKVVAFFTWEKSPSSTFRITALVAPTTSQQYRSDSNFSHADLLGIEERITFDVDCDKVPEQLRCSCLASGNECTAKHLEVHYVMEWAAGSIMENEEVEIGGEIVRREKRGRPKIWEGWCKNGGLVYLGPTERMRCIEGYYEYLREQMRADGIKRTNSCE